MGKQAQNTTILKDNPTVQTKVSKPSYIMLDFIVFLSLINRLFINFLL